uniref:Uncharacterized protein n=1 Tax=Arundo donax TaxID=35708 RepID=A0A0A9F7E5_ARUDO
MIVPATSDPKFLNDGAWPIGLTQRRSMRFGAFIERPQNILHLTIVKVFKEADEISWPDTKQSLRSISSKEGHREESCLRMLSSSWA